MLDAILSLDAFNNRTLQPGADGVPDFAGERLICFGDQANMPCGNYAKIGKEFCLRRYHSGGTARFDKPPVKAIVVACNTAAAFGIGDIRNTLEPVGTLDHFGRAH